MSNPSPLTLALVIPSYNRSSLIGETIERALAQTRPFDEIIVVDDGSTDNTREVLERFGKRISTIFVQNGGVQKARNLGVSTSRCQYVTLCDSDDLLTTDHAETILGWLDTNADCDVVYTNLRNFDQDGVRHADKLSLAPPSFFHGARVTGDFYSEIADLYVKSLEYQPFFSSGVTLRKSFYEQLGGFDTRFNRIGSEDWEFTLRVLSHGRLAYCSRVLTEVRRHSGNDSADTMHMALGEALILEFALEHHKQAAHHAHAIRGWIEQKRGIAFQLCFDRGDFAGCRKIDRLIKRHPGGLKHAMKRIITRLPEPLRKAIWKKIQSS